MNISNVVGQSVECCEEHLVKLRRPNDLLWLPLWSTRSWEPRKYFVYLCLVGVCVFVGFDPVRHNIKA